MRERLRCGAGVVGCPVIFPARRDDRPVDRTASADDRRFPERNVRRSESGGQAATWPITVSGRLTFRLDFRQNGLLHPRTLFPGNRIIPPEWVWTGLESFRF